MVSRSERRIAAFRIADRRFPPLDGTGARIYGGRWNSPGRPAVYASLRYASALLETLAHTGRARIPPGLRGYVIESRGAIAVEEIDARDVPGWQNADCRASRTFGDLWLSEARSAALIVPSAVAPPHERNVVLNPAHADFAKIRASAPETLYWDDRLFAR